MALICILLLLFYIAFLLRIVMTFFPIAHGSPAGAIRDLVVAVTDPVVWPVRRAVPPLSVGSVNIGVAELIILIVMSVLIGLFC